MWFKKKHRESLYDDNPNLEGRYIAKMEISPEGGELTHVMGEKYAMRGNAKFLALRALEPIKAIIDKIITSRLVNLIPFSVSNEKLTPPVQELARVFDLLIEGEKLEEHKKQWKAYKKVFCVFLEHDFPYRYKLQWILERLNIDKMKLTDGDKYFFRVKNFWVDLEEDYKEVQKNHPEMDFIKFKEWLGKSDSWGEVDMPRVSMEDLAKQFIINQKT